MADEADGPLYGASADDRVGRSRKFFGNFQWIAPFFSGMPIDRCFNALPIQTRNVCLFPFTTTGEQPSPIKGRIAFR